MNAPVEKICQYCRKEKTTQFIRTASGKRWKCQACKDKRTGGSK